MIDPRHLRHGVVRPTLRAMSAWSLAAEDLVLRTAAAERCRQHGSGPGIGLWQIEPRVHRDNWAWLPDRPAAYAGVMRTIGACDWDPLEDPVFSHAARGGLARQLEDQLAWNLAYACAHARIRYLRDPSPIPADAAGQARYWVRVYASAHGAESQFLAAARGLYARYPYDGAAAASRPAPRVGWPG